MVGSMVQCFVASRCFVVSSRLLFVLVVLSESMTCLSFLRVSFVLNRQGGRVV